MKTENQFFDEFAEAEWEFTYGHLENMDYNVLQVGLTAIFYISDGWRPEKRKAMTQAIERYIEEFGNKLKWGFIDNVNKPEPFNVADKDGRMQRLSDLEDGAADTLWSSEHYKKYVGNYQVDLFSPAGWFEHIHKPLSYTRFFLPISELKNNGRERFERLIIDFCQLLKPMHGIAGLGTQQLYDDNPYQYLECEIAQQFSGIDITTPLSGKGLRNGIRSVNWYTILSDDWINKAGGQQYLQQQFANSDIILVPYQGGTLIRAGAWPELGWTEKEPLPENYVRVNQVLRSVRTPSFGSFHLGSNAGEIRLNDTLTEKWQKRFDVALSPERAEKGVKQVRITARSGEICPYSGRWVTSEGGHQQFIHQTAGSIMPEATQYQGNIYAADVFIPAIWNLLERDDGGSTMTE